MKTTKKALRDRAMARARQTRIRERRQAAGYVRREYWGSPAEHSALADTLAKLRGEEEAGQ